MSYDYFQTAARNARSRAAGATFEKIIADSCDYYRKHGDAEIEKTPEPMKPLRRLKGGQFVACYEKMAQPDYKGTIKGGQSIVFEAKHTDSDRLLQSCISTEQEDKLNRHQALGAECYVLVSFGFQNFYKVPWEYFKNMKRYAGRKYITPNDPVMEKYKIRYISGVLRFLW